MELLTMLIVIGYSVSECRGTKLSTVTKYVWDF